jgi:nitric oxide reductase NorD protein
MSLSEHLTDIERRLARHAASLPAEFRRAEEEVSTLLPEEQLQQWAEEGLALASHSLRSWEAASEFFRVSPQVLRVLGFPLFMRWAHQGRDLAEHSSLVAAAYFRASPSCAAQLAGSDLAHWAALGQRLYKGNWKSISLASVFFSASPGLLSNLSLAEVERLVSVVDSLAERSYELAASCLDAAPQLFGTLDKADRAPFLDFAAAIAQASWADARLYFEKGHASLSLVQADCRPRFLELSARVARSVGRQAYAFFADAAAAMGNVDQRAHSHLISLAEELAVGSPAAAMEFLKSAPDVLKRIPVADLARWHSAGHRILEQTQEGGEAYFRLESGKGEAVLEALSPRVDLSRVSGILHLYCQALTGVDVAIHPSTALVEKGIGWVSEANPSTEGRGIYLPEFVEEHAEKKDNFAVFKVCATHQAAHLEFGSFYFTFQRRGKVYPARRRRRETQLRKEGLLRRDKKPLTDMQRFFDLFPDRRLALDIFTIVEDARVDFMVREEYGGIRGAWRRMQLRELECRPEITFLPLRQALLENLVRVSLDGGDRLMWPPTLREYLATGISLLRSVQRPDALVEDAAEVTLLLHDLVMRLPNLPAEELGLDWEALGEEALDLMMVPPGATPGRAPDFGDLPSLPQGGDQDYDSPEPVDFRGDFKPELVQLLMRLRDDVQPDMGPLSALTPEQLKELLENSAEISIGAMAEGDLASTIGLFLSNLEKEAGTPVTDQEIPLQDGQPVLDAGEEKELPQEVKSFYYDEWDFRAADYRPRWCRVQERVLEEGGEDFFDDTMKRHAALAEETRKQFEMLRPELFRKIKHLYDGEDFDLDLVIDYLVEKKSGHSLTDKVYWRRNKVERDVAVAFLLDMSASTDEEIEKRKKPKQDDDFNDDPRQYFQWLAQRRAQAMLEPPKRIIDLEKESTVLLIRALETIGDSYGIYGFSGYGRDNVEFYVLKDLEEPFDDRVRRRIDKVSPIRSTRMGPAIRHAIAKLDAHESKVKILFLVSDGRPQDHGYGRDRTEKEYAIHDTHKALIEAKRKGIVPFCLTVDKEGHEYLGQMCEDVDYEILGDIEALPSRLPTLYRRLTV